MKGLNQKQAKVEATDVVDPMVLMPQVKMTSLYLPRGMYAKLIIRSEKERVDVNRLIVKAIDDSLKKFEGQV
jgi:hypothetical protein